MARVCCAQGQKQANGAMASAVCEWSALGSGTEKGNEGLPGAGHTARRVITLWAVLRPLAAGVRAVAVGGLPSAKRFSRLEGQS